MQLYYPYHTFDFTPLNNGTAFDVFAQAAFDFSLQIENELTNHAGVESPKINLAGLEKHVVGLHRSRPTVGQLDDINPVTVLVKKCNRIDACANVDWVVSEHSLTDDRTRRWKRL
ncbi:hypothetical protein [Haladaptatus halobius]|uniref:hypothetical protein n=1 Tax=Haladaptatus halobius TaxID=2884875 RepID=UPI001D09A2C0|nr:hypothetical protein [Haladaptatus halobius]